MPECYDFDHRPGETKRFSVGVNVRRNWNVILDEIAKCDVVCSNCHRVRTLARIRANGLKERGVAELMVDHMGRHLDLWGMARARGLL